MTQLGVFLSSDDLQVMKEPVSLFLISMSISFDCLHGMIIV